ncbi:hypothetical protein J0895_14495 [Phormidium pseudopriestleyi FRX01]|uniref:Uncharacterized protein n=1 Tax=Phormidium pseudopriestleyi FRX01 TaxID=1759528 RepID=A0ABS3FVB5_9CYAN|nr:hypothetical protein [Phormidium pseudopriestleyi]MBO0350292.1 hypothetical protein [Phormidium pseudopriestleyi FRX01]
MTALIVVWDGAVARRSPFLYQLALSTGLFPPETERIHEIIKKISVSGSDSEILNFLIQFRPESDRPIAVSL